MEVVNIQTINNSPFTLEQVKAALHMVGGHRKIDFRYELLDLNLNVITELKNVISADISQSAFAQIKRTARFTIRESAEIDYLSDRIKPYVRLWIPPGKMLARYYAFLSLNFPAKFAEISAAPEKGGWVEFPMGVFLLSSPTRKETNGRVTRDIEAFDGLVILLQDRFDSRYTIEAGVNYYDAVISILQSAGITRYNIERTDKLLSNTIEFEPGREKLFAVNELLRQINFTPIHVDVNGTYTSMEYRSPSDRAADYRYATDEQSITFPEYEEELDLFNVPNKWTVVRTNAEEEPLLSTYTNDNPDSPTSTVNRGFVISDYREIENIADQNALDAYTQRIASEASQVYGKVAFETAINPLHDYSDVLELDFKELGINGKYHETSWSMPLIAGGRMRHEVRKVVSI